jgi:hypothetical protein
MHSIYGYISGVTQAQLLSDIVAMLTGETNKANLSAGCDQAATTISAAYDVAGWTVYDAAAGTNAQVLRAPCVGDGSQYKYAEINTNTSGQVFIGLWESWNSGTHTGTNLSFLSKTSGYGQRYATAAAGVIYISASSGRIIMYGVSSAGNGNSTNLSSCGILEFDRGYTWCGVGQGFTPALFWEGLGNCSCPRFKDVSGNVQTASTSKSQLVSMGLGLNPNSPYPFQGGSGAPMSSGFAFPISACAVHPAGATTNFCASGLSAAGVFTHMGGYANNLDEVPYDSKTWLCMPISSTGGGHSKILVPKG